MLRKIAFATITAAALVAPASLVHALGGTNGVGMNGWTSNGVGVNGNGLNGSNLNGVWQNGQNLNGIKPAGREVYFVGEQTRGEGSTVLTIELPQDRVAR